MDLHCHDLNSDKPDELWGRILNLRETWIPGNHLKNILYANGVHAITITNHNNCLSCWQLMEQGHDVLAEPSLLASSKNMIFIYMFYAMA